MGEHAPEEQRDAALGEPAHGFGIHEPGSIQGADICRLW
jgi:hypothetical protein